MFTPLFTLRLQHYYFIGLLCIVTGTTQVNLRRASPYVENNYPSSEQGVMKSCFRIHVI